MNQIKYYWEDLLEGSTRELGSTTASAEDMKAFAEEFDPQPFHVDEVEGRKSIYGNLCASGWHTCALAMRLMVDNFLRDSSSLGSPGIENLRWMKPVYPGDRLSLRMTIIETRASRSRKTVGLARTRWEMFNQNGEMVMHLEGYGMFRRRYPATPEELARLDAERPGR